MTNNYEKGEITMEIKELRMEIGLSQAAAAKYCHNIPLRTWESWEGGERTPPAYVEDFIIEKLEYMKEDMEDLKSFIIQSCMDEDKVFAEINKNLVKKLNYSYKVALSVIKNEISIIEGIVGKKYSELTEIEEDFLQSGNLYNDSIIDYPCGLSIAGSVIDENDETIVEAEENAEFYISIDILEGCLFDWDNAIKRYLYRMLK